MIKKVYPFICLVFVFVLTACPDSKMPISEMIKAKETIARAEELKADTYSKENLDSAISLLSAAHDQSLDGDSKKAKKSAEDSIAAAQKAIDESLPLLAADTIELAKSSAEAAKNFNAEEYAKEDYDNALKSLEAAENLNSESKYEDSYAASTQSIEFSDKAMEACKAQIPAIRRSLAEVTTARNNIVARRSQNNEVQGILTSTQANIDTANASIDAGMLIVANKEIKDAGDSLVTAKLLVDIEDQMKIVDSLKTQVDQLGKTTNASFAQKELADATTSLNSAATAAGNKNLQQTTDNAAAASKSVEDAKSKIASADQASKRLADVKAAAETLFNRLPDEDEFESEAQVTKIKDQLAQGDQFFAKQDLPNVLSTAGNAERDINSLRSAFDSHLAAQKRAEEEAARVARAAEAEEEAARRAAAAAEEEAAAKRIAAAVTGDTSEQTRQAGDGETYVVRYTPPNHDSLWRIAWRFYKDASFWPLIFMENKDQIKNPDLIFPGQQFTIPALDQDMSANREAVRKIRNENLRNR